CFDLMRINSYHRDKAPHSAFGGERDRDIGIQRSRTRPNALWQCRAASVSRFRYYGARGGRAQGMEFARVGRLPARLQNFAETTARAHCVGKSSASVWLAEQSIG